jgi:RNA recognition motif-containing protein
VGNLNFRTTKEELTEHLAPAGTIVDVHLPTDRETGRPRGFAFVQFASDAEAAEAIRQFNGSELSGRRLNINEAEERPRRAGPGAGPGGPGPRMDSRPPRRGPMDSAPPSDPGPAPDLGRPEGSTEGFDGDFEGGRHFRGKGSRRGLRARKRSL